MAKNIFWCWKAKEDMLDLESEKSKFWFYVYGLDNFEWLFKL